MPTSPTTFRRRPGLRACALGTTGALVLAAGIAMGGEAALATDGITDITTLQSDFSDTSVTTASLGQDIDASSSVLTLAAGGNMLLNLRGHTLRLNLLQLTTPDGSGGFSYSSLHVYGGGSLIVNQTQDPALAAIEVDSGSTLMLDGITVRASVPTVAGSTGAGIGGGSAAGQPRTAGTIQILGRADVTAAGSALGAAIGGGSRGDGGSISVQGDAVVHASTTGDGAAIGGGDRPLAGKSGSITISDHASVSATSSGQGAAIGGGYQGGAGTVAVGDFAAVTADATSGQVAIGDGSRSNEAMSFQVSGLTNVTARGGSGAGIGSGPGANGGDTISISGRSTVQASAVTGPGIGGTGNSVGATVTVGDSASVSASGGNGGAAIGAGDGSSIGTALSIGRGATVSVRAGSASAIGGASASRFGSLTNDGALVLEGGQQLTVPSGVTVSNNSSFVNNGTVTTNGTLTNSGTISNTGRLTGSGTLTNSGTVVQGGALDVPVTGNAFEIVYDSQGGSVNPGTQLVYADTLRAAQLALPAATPPSTGNFSGWNTSADGTGTGLDAGGSLGSIAGGTANGSPFRFRVYALYQLAPVLPAGALLGQAVVGTGYSASVAATTGTAPITYSYTGDLPAGLTLDTSKGTISGTPTTAGTFTLHLTARNNAGTATRDYTIQVVPTVLHVSAPSTPKKNARYLAGAKLDLALSGFQANESYTISVGSRKVATGRAPTSGAFTVRIAVPRTIGDGTQTVRVAGSGHLAAATSKILTASVSKSLGLKASTKKPKAKKKLSLTVSKLYAGESVRIVISGKHKQAVTGRASASGVYKLTLKKGLKKGKYKVAVTGAGTSRTAHTTLTVK